MNTDCSEVDNWGAYQASCGMVAETPCPNGRQQATLRCEAESEPRVWSKYQSLAGLRHRTSPNAMRARFPHRAQVASKYVRPPSSDSIGFVGALAGRQHPSQYMFRSISDGDRIIKRNASWDASVIKDISENEVDVQQTATVVASDQVRNGYLAPTPFRSRSLR